MITELSAIKIQYLTDPSKLTTQQLTRIQTVLPYNLDAWDGYAYEREALSWHVTKAEKASGGIGWRYTQCLVFDLVCTKWPESRSKSWQPVLCHLQGWKKYLQISQQIYTALSKLLLY